MLEFFFFFFYELRGHGKIISSIKSIIVWLFLGVFRGNPAQVKEYQDLLDPLLQHTPEGIFWKLF